MAKVIGRCSVCNGYIYEEETKCFKCGAVKKDNLPVIQMEEVQKPQMLLD